MAKMRLSEQDKQRVDTVLGLVLYGIGLAFLATGFFLALSEAVPSLTEGGAGIIVGAVVFGIGVAVFKMRI